jgi:hypothetical protein
MEHTSRRIDKTAVAGGADIQVPALKPTLDQPMMSEFIARCCEDR